MKTGPKPKLLTPEQIDFIKSHTRLTIKERASHIDVKYWVVQRYMDRSGINARGYQRRKSAKVIEGYFDVDRYAKSALI